MLDQLDSAPQLARAGLAQKADVQIGGHSHLAGGAMMGEQEHVDRKVNQPEKRRAGHGAAGPQLVAAGDKARQTYIGLVCGADDTLYVAFRMWRSGEPPFPLSHHATLAYQRKPPGQPWQPPQILGAAKFSRDLVVETTLVFAGDRHSQWIGG